jgi:hypothetical protein
MYNINATFNNLYSKLLFPCIMFIFIFSYHFRNIKLQNYQTPNSKTITKHIYKDLMIKCLHKFYQSQTKLP